MILQVDPQPCLRAFKASEAIFLGVLRFGVWDRRGLRVSGASMSEKLKESP